MKLKFKDGFNGYKETELNVEDVAIMTGDHDETILIETTDGVFYKAIVVNFVKEDGENDYV